MTDKPTIATATGDITAAGDEVTNTVTVVSVEFYVRMEHSDGSTHMVQFNHQDLLNFLNNIEVGEPKTCENCNESEGCEHEILRSEGVACDEWSDD